MEGSLRDYRPTAEVREAIIAKRERGREGEGGRVRMREREKERERDGEKERERDGERESERARERERERENEGERERESERLRDRRGVPGPARACLRTYVCARMRSCLHVRARACLRACVPAYSCACACLKEGGPLGAAGAAVLTADDGCARGGLLASLQLRARVCVRAPLSWCVRVLVR